MKRIALAGHICLDLIPKVRPDIQVAPGRLIEIGALTMKIGGCVGNTARTLAGLGASFSAFTMVGEDILGDVVRREVSELGGDSTGIVAVPGGSTSYSVIVDPPAGDRTIWHHVGVSDHFDGETVELEGVELLHVGYPVLIPKIVEDGGAPLERLLARAKQAGAITSLDLAVVDRDAPAGLLDWETILRRACAHTDVISPSFDDVTSAISDDDTYTPARALALAEQLLEWGVAVVALSAGEHGMTVRSAGRARIAAAGLDASWADLDLVIAPKGTVGGGTTNGAGDTSTAGLLYGIADGRGAIAALELAAECAASLVEGRPLPKQR